MKDVGDGMPFGWHTYCGVQNCVYVQHCMHACIHSGYYSKAALDSLGVSHADHHTQEIRALIEECWAPDPEDRPQFVDVVDKLEDIMSKVPRSASAPKQHFTEPSDTQKECCSVQ